MEVLISGSKALLLNYMKTKTEKRSTNRVAIHQRVSFEMSDRESGRFKNILENGMGVDISQRGMGLCTDYLLKQGDILKVFVPLGIADTSLPVFTEVMWTTAADGRLRAGLRFLA